MISAGKLCDDGRNILLTDKAAYILPSDTEIPAQATQIAQRTQDGLYEINQDMLEYKRAYICETKPSNPLTL